MVLLPMGEVLVGGVSGGKLLLLEVVRVAHGWADALRGPLRVTDRLVDIRLSNIRVHDTRGDRMVGVEITWPDTFDGGTCQPGVHCGGGLVCRLGVRQGPCRPQED